MPSNFYQRSAVALAVAACFPGFGYAAGVARVDFAVGNVTAVRPDGRSRALSRGSEIEVGDTVNTQQGRAQLRFVDGAFMSLQPETSFKVDEFRFAENGGGKDGIVMNLLKGGMRTITGLIGRANRQNYRLRTAVATIGIRGTEYAVRYTNSVEVFCAGGSISVENEGGTLVLGSGQGGFVQDPKQEPQRTEERPFLPPTAASGTQESQEQIAPPVNPVQESQTAALLTGTNTYSLALAFDSCGDSCFDATATTAVTATLDSEGHLASFEGGRGTTIGRGTASVVDASNDGVIAWGRWVNGTLTGEPLTLSGNDSVHYVVGLPTPSADILALQAGNVTASYALLGGTSATSDFGEVGKLEGGMLTARFGTTQVDVDLKIGMSQNIYTVSGRAIPISGSGFSASNLATTGCFSSCSTDISGFFAGAMAARAGLSYLITDFGRGNTIGTAAFIKK
ncbi:MAG TPA: FecR family protein [Woeseiaceae bacterium]|nr:FecR family protein [Woeseiaceae bacterium]